MGTRSPFAHWAHLPTGSVSLFDIAPGHWGGRDIVNRPARPSSDFILSFGNWSNKKITQNLLSRPTKTPPESFTAVKICCYQAVEYVLNSCLITIIIISYNFANTCEERERERERERLKKREIKRERERLKREWLKERERERETH